MFVLFIDFLSHFLSPCQLWHHPELRNTKDFRNNTGPEHLGVALDCLGEGEEQNVLVMLWNA